MVNQINCKRYGNHALNEVCILGKTVLQKENSLYEVKKFVTKVYKIKGTSIKKWSANLNCKTGMGIPPETSIR